MSLVDWAEAFDRQCPNIGIQSFIDNDTEVIDDPIENLLDISEEEGTE